MSSLFNEILYKPLFNGLIIFYNSVAFQDLGLAIIFLTLLIRLILFPLFHQSLRHQRLTQELQPHIKAIQNKHKDNKEAQTRAILELYSTHKANPLMPIILILIQLPILIALFRIFSVGVNDKSLELLYSFVSRPGTIHYTLLGLVDLGKQSLYVTGIAAAFQYLQSRLSLPPLKPGQELNQTEKIGRNMVYMAPILTIVVLFRLPAAIGLYWLTTTAFSLLQQIVVNRIFTNGETKGATK